MLPDNANHHHETKNHGDSSAQQDCLVQSGEHQGEPRLLLLAAAARCMDFYSRAPRPRERAATLKRSVDALHCRHANEISQFHPHSLFPLIRQSPDSSQLFTR